MFKLTKALTGYILMSAALLGCGESYKMVDAPEQAFTTAHVLDHVDPMIGTGAHGHTFPGATTPFGMVQLSPDTHNEGWDWCSGYHYSDESIMGFSHTHLSGTGRGDLLDILVMPMIGELKTEPGSRENPDEGYRSRFSHDREQASPGYYRVMLDDYDILAEITTSPRVGFHKYTLPSSETVQLIIDPVHGRVGDEVKKTEVTIVNDTLVTGVRKSRGWGEGDEKYWANQQVYFAASFSRPFTESGVVDNGKIQTGRLTSSGTNSKGYVSFEGTQDNTLLVKVAISAVDVKGALANLQEEIPHWDFDQTRQEAEALWTDQLSSYKATSQDEDIKRTYYTALYHTMIAPSLFHDVDGRYRGSDGQIKTSKDFTNYTVFSLWDTFRATHPLYTLTEEDRITDMIHSMLAQYDEYGLLPVWSLHGSETNCMIGYHSVPVIVDAYMKGIGGFDAEKAYQAMKTSAMQDGFGIKYLKECNYIPTDLHNKSVSKTLEYAFDDWCLAQMAKALGKQEDYDYFMRRSTAYQNVFDPTDNFMKGKNADGTWADQFDPTFASYGKSDFIEGNSWQYSWFVPHDIPGLIQLMGGESAFVNHLDQLFEQQQALDEDAPIDITGLIGQYAHGNEPSHHVAYMYNYAGQPWKTQEHVHEIMTKLYNSTPEGLSGNEDCGQMSAWYVFSAMGMYPVNPSNGQYAFGKPMLDEVEISLASGNTFKVTANDLSPANIYVQSITLEGQPYERYEISHERIMKGGHLVFNMGASPNKNLQLAGLLPNAKELAD